MPSASNSGQTIPSASTPIPTTPIPNLSAAPPPPLPSTSSTACSPDIPLPPPVPTAPTVIPSPPDQRIRHLQATPTSRPTQLLSHHRQPRLVLRFQAIRKPCQRPRPPPHTDIMSHFYSPKSPDPVLFSLGNERSHVYAYLPTFSITTLTSRKNSKSPKRAVWTDFRHLGFTHD